MRGLPLLILLGGLLVVSPAASAWSADFTSAADVHGLTFAPGTLRVIGEGVLIQFPMEGGAPLSWHEIRGDGEGGEFRVDLWPVPYGPANPVRYQLLSSNSALYLFDWIEGDLVTLPSRDGADLWEWDELPNADVVILEWTRTAVDVRVVAVDASDGTPLWEVERGFHGDATESLLPYDGSHAIMFSQGGSELLIVGR